MENKELINSIDISMFEENEIINLLLKIVELSNDKVSLLNKEIADFTLTQEKLKEENASLKIQVQTMNSKEIESSHLIEQLEANLNNANTEIKVQKSTIQESSDRIKLLDSDLAKANVSIQELKQNVYGLNKMNHQLESDLFDKTKFIESQDETINGLKERNNHLNDIIDENKIDIVKIYANMLSKLLTSRINEDSSWNKYLENICQKISKFIKETTNLEILSYSLKSSNSWLTKISSIIWWSKQSNISSIVNENVPNINELNEVFEDFIQFLSNVDIMIQLPNGVICEEIGNYEANLKEKTNFNDLFGDYGLSEGYLCEIYKLAVNGNKGLCLIFKS